MKTLKPGRALACALLVLSTTSYAQYGGGMGGAGGMRRGRGPDGPAAGAPGGAAPSASASESLADKLFDLRVRLLITPEQVPAWDVFYSRFMAQALVPARGMAMDGSPPSALQALQQRLSLAQNRYAMVESLTEAAKALLAQLTPEQQRIADEQIPRLLNETGGERPQRTWSRDAGR